MPPTHISAELSAKVFQSESLRCVMTFLGRLALFAAVAASAGCTNSAQVVFYQEAKRLPALEEEARRLGLPTTGAELAPDPPVLPEENAAPLLRQAFAAMDSAESANPDLFRAVVQALDEPTAENLEAGRRALALLQPALEAATLAAAKPRVDFGRNWESDKTWAIEFPELAKMRQLVRALSARGALRVWDGDPVGATADFRTGFAISRFAGADPVLVSGLVQMAAETSVVQQMERALAVRPRDVSFVRALGALAAEEASRPPDPFFYLRGEVGFAVAFVRDPERVAFDETIAPPDESGAPFRPNLNLHRKIVPRGIPIDVLRDAYRAKALAPWVEVFGSEEARQHPLKLRAILEDLPRRHADPKDPTAVLNQIIFPAYGPFAEGFALREARLSTVRGLASALVFRAENGRFPTSLSEAGVELTDPFDGQPLRYRVEGETVQVWSVGPDLLDNDGKARNEIRTSEAIGWDVVSRFSGR